MESLEEFISIGSSSTFLICLVFPSRFLQSFGFLMMRDCTIDEEDFTFASKIIRNLSGKRKDCEIEFHVMGFGLQMGRVGHKLGIQFVISVGDNFYQAGLKGPHDPKFKNSFSKVYTARSLQTQWFAGRLKVVLSSCAQSLHRYPNLFSN